jgi:hypothetical protein
MQRSHVLEFQALHTVLCRTIEQLVANPDDPTVVFELRQILQQMMRLLP